MEEEENKKIRALDVVLRLPGVIMLELLYMETITLKNWTLLMDNYYRGPSWNVDIVLYALAWAVIVLPQKALLNLYSCIVSFASMALSHYVLRQLLIQSNIVQSDDNFKLTPSNNITMSRISWIHIITEKQSIIESCATVILCQLVLVLLSCRIINAKPKSLFLFSSPLYPWLTGLFTSSVLIDSITISHLITCAAVLIYHTPTIDVIALQLRMKVFWIKVQLIARIFGWQGVITWAQDEYQVQRLLVVCWILRFVVQLFANLYQSFHLSKLDQTVFENFNIDMLTVTSGMSITILLFSTTVQCLTTTINLFGLVCVVKNIVKLQYFLTRSWLHWTFHDHPPDSVSGPLTGVIDGITLLIMTLYTDTLNTELGGRLVLMIYILFTIASSQFQSMFNIIDPILMTLATAHNGSVWKHLRTVTFALILLSISGILSYISFFAMSSTFWVFIIAYNFVNTFSLMLGSLSIYCILMIDYLTLRGWTSLDDVMFYIRASCRGVEFCVTLCMCGYIMMTFYNEMSSVAGIIMLAVYTYYCIVQRGGKGWKIWMMRRQASNKVRSLPLASQKDLQERDDDLCPICYQQMDGDVRIMHCHHLFHENCLKKWFYIQDKCPMCYAQFNSPVKPSHVEGRPGTSKDKLDNGENDPTLSQNQS